jgi:branched-chain amino acid transport system permease protein
MMIMAAKKGKGKWYWIAWTAVVAIALFLPAVASEYITILASRALIFAIVAFSLNILIGYTGLGHIGHAAFFAIGGYTTAILATRLNAPFAITLPAAIGLTVIASAVAALLLLRATGLFFLIISLAIAMCIWGLIYRWVSMTGGDNGIRGIPRPDLGIPWDFSSTNDFYYFILLVFAICLVLMVLIIQSPYGKTLMGIRDEENRMRVLGYNVWLHKYLAIIIASAFAGLAGNLYAYYNTFIAPSMADLGTCMDFVLMVIIGGPGTLPGALIGSIIIVFLKELVSVYTARWVIFLGIAYIITGLYAPEGITGLWRSYVQKKSARAKANVVEGEK